MQVGIIVAVDPKGIIGVDGQIPWKFSPDMKRFKALTMGGTLILGRKTFESMGKRQLPGRSTILISRTAPVDVLTFHSVEGAIKHARTRGESIWICGGSQVYREVLEKGLADFVELTLVPEVTLPAVPREVVTFPMELLSMLTLVSTTEAPDAPLTYKRYERPLWTTLSNSTSTRISRSSSSPGRARSTRSTPSV